MPALEPSSRFNSAAVDETSVPPSFRPLVPLCDPISKSCAELSSENTVLPLMIGLVSTACGNVLFVSVYVPVCVAKPFSVDWSGMT